MVGELATVQTAVQDWKNKSLGMLGQTPGVTPNPSGGLTVPGTSLPTSGVSPGRFQADFADTATQASVAHARFMDTVTRRQDQLRYSNGQAVGGMGARSAAGMGPAGGWGGQYGLQKNAAAAFSRLSAAYRARWGSPLVVNSGGRSYAEQARLFALYKAGRGNLAAPPGTSVHEFGRAVDLGGAIRNRYSAQHLWLQRVAQQYGFSWTGRWFKQIEPWHWEYVGK